MKICVKLLGEAGVGGGSGEQDSRASSLNFHRTCIAEKFCLNPPRAPYSLKFLRLKISRILQVGAALVLLHIATVKADAQSLLFLDFRCHID